MSKNDGGHAFPNITPDMNVDGGPGMSLRDWFAGRAIPDATALTFDVDYVEYARRAYGIADALIAERERKP